MDNSDCYVDIIYHFASTFKCSDKKIISLLNIHRQLHKKGINPVSALCPYLAAVVMNDTLRNGKPKAVAAAHGASFVGPVKTLEYVS